MAAGANAHITVALPKLCQTKEATMRKGPHLVIMHPWTEAMVPLVREIVLQA